jgi:hypothetical protein
MCGTCNPSADAAPADVCRGPRTTFNVPLTSSLPDAGTAQTVTYHWADLTGGNPFATVDPRQLTGILWFFPDAPADGGSTGTDAGLGGDGGIDALPPAGTPSYDVDFIIDNVRFLPF